MARHRVRQRGGVLGYAGLCVAVLGLGFLVCTPTWAQSQDMPTTAKTATKARAPSASKAGGQRAETLSPKRPEAWRRLGLLELQGGNLAGAQASFERMLALGSERGDKAAIATAAYGLGGVHAVRAGWMGTDAKVAAMWGASPKNLMNSGDSEFVKAKAMFEKSLALNKALGRNQDTAVGYVRLGALYRRDGDLDRAEAMFKQSLALNKASRRRKEMAADYSHLGGLYQARGDLDRAETMIRQALALCTSLQLKTELARSYIVLAAVYKSRGELDRAEAIYKQALALADTQERYTITLDLEDLYRARGDKEQMQRMRADADALAKEWGSSLIIFRPSLYLSGRFSKGQTEALQKAVPLEKALGHDVGLATSYTLLGLHHLRRDELDGAERMFKDAVVLNEALGRQDEVARLYAELGRVEQKRGDKAQACAHFRKGAEAFPNSRTLIDLLNRGGCAER